MWAATYTLFIIDDTLCIIDGVQAGMVEGTSLYYRTLSYTVLCSYSGLLISFFQDECFFFKISFLLIARGTPFYLRSYR